MRKYIKDKPWDSRASLARGKKSTGRWLRLHSRARLEERTSRARLKSWDFSENVRVLRMYVSILHTNIYLSLVF